MELRPIDAEVRCARERLAGCLLPLSTSRAYVVSGNDATLLLILMDATQYSPDHFVTPTRGGNRYSVVVFTE